MRNKKWEVSANKKYHEMARRRASIPRGVIQYSARVYSVRLNFAQLHTPRTSANSIYTVYNAFFIQQNYELFKLVLKTNY